MKWDAIDWRISTKNKTGFTSLHMLGRHGGVMVNSSLDTVVWVQILAHAKKLCCVLRQVYTWVPTNLVLQGGVE